MIFNKYNKNISTLIRGAVVFCLFIVCNPTFAQHYVGVKGILGYNGVDALPSFERTTLQTFSPGILYRYEHKKYAALQIEANYINKGYVMELDTARGTPEIRHKITSFELPLMAQGFIRLGAFRPYLTGGFVLGYILERKVEQMESDYGSLFPAGSFNYHFDDHDRRFEYGIAGGGGLGVRISRFEIQAECRYHYNFSFLRNPVIKGEPNQYLNSTQLVFSLALMYKL